MSVTLACASPRPQPRASLVRAGCLIVLAVLTIGGTAPSCPAQAERPRVAVFAADGAGNFKTASSVLRQTALEDGLPLEVYSFEWSHGYARVFSDQMVYGHTCERGRRLADEMIRYHAAHPETPIHLYAHSAGCTVAMKALEALPPGVVDRTFLLSPSLSAAYDPGPALAKVNCGVHVFYSRQDWCFLGLTTRLLGTADRRHGCCSGRYGFQVDVGHLDPALQAKLFQRAWQPEDRALGSNGGHYGFYQPSFLRAYILPLLCP